jgi:ribosome-associated toxin RatA of RatAB toxin-antitoxin module
LGVVRRLLFPLTALAALLLVTEASPGAGLTTREMQRLLRGETVVRTQLLRRGDRRYVGGVTYSVVDADADGLVELLEDVDAWRRILPKTRSARSMGTAGNDALVELTHGSAFMQATYTMRVRREGRVVRFWMDPGRRHDIEDAWGFVRAEPMADGRALVTYGVLIDMGPGLLRDLFEDSVRELALSVPDRVRGLMLERSARGRRASR